MTMPFNRAGSVRQNSASQSLYARKDRGHQPRVRHLEVKEPLRGIEDFTPKPRGAEMKIFAIGTTLRYRVQAIEPLDLHPFEVSGIM